MSPALLRFLRQMFVSLFVGRSEAICEKVFLKVAEVPKLHLLREGVRLFLRHFFLRDADQVDPSLRATLEERVAAAEDVLSLGDKKAVL
uniref:Protein involved in high osmolarity signaling pathway n=2 Tax=Ixodes ricinus TaxID=34613 RepID=V5ICD5_IXORI